jgi:hypothetical protein
MRRMYLHARKAIEAVNMPPQGIVSRQAIPSRKDATRLHAASQEHTRRKTQEAANEQNL